jgi:hypothetical protein
MFVLHITGFSPPKSVFNRDLASQVVLIAWETLWQMSLQEHLGEPIYGKIGVGCRCGW